MDFVDEKHVALFEIGQQRRKVAGLRYDGAGCGAETDAKLLRQDLRQRRLAETRRPGKKHVIERIAASTRRLMKTRRLARACSWPMNSSSDCGRIVASRRPRPFAHR